MTPESPGCSRSPWSSSLCPGSAHGSGLALDLPTSSEWEVWAGLLFLVLLDRRGTAGIYPSLVAARIRPAEALRRDPVLGGGGRMRSLLVACNSPSRSP